MLDDFPSVRKDWSRGAVISIQWNWYWKIWNSSFKYRGVCNSLSTPVGGEGINSSFSGCGEENEVKFRKGKELAGAETGSGGA